MRAAPAARRARRPPPRRAERPKPGPGQALVRVEAVGLCGSDLHWFEEGGIGGTTDHPADRARPRVRRADGGRPARGDRPRPPVRPLPALPRGPPEPLPAGPLLRPGRGRRRAARVDGVADALPRAAARRPQRHRRRDARAARRRRSTRSTSRTCARASRVGVFGCGPIGLFCLQVAQAAGAARLVATDLASRPHRLEAARALGAEVFAAEDGREARRSTAVGGPASTSPSRRPGTEAAVDAAVESVGPGGRVVLAGIPSDERICFRVSARAARA